MTKNKVNPSRRHLPHATNKQQRQYEHILSTEKALGKGVRRAKSIAAATVRKLAGNPYSDYLIYGQAELTDKGWKVAGKYWPTGKGIVAFSRKGLFLDRATGTVYKKVIRANPKSQKTKSNRQDIHQVVRDYIRAGRSQKQILDLMKKSGFDKKLLVEARKIYTKEKQCVRKMMTGKNPGGKGVVSKVSKIKKVGSQVLKVTTGAISGAVSGIKKATKNPSLMPREELVLKVMLDSTDHGRGLVSIREIHSKIGRSGKRFTDQALRKLAHNGYVHFHKHVFPASLTREERKFMLKDVHKGQTHYYIGVQFSDKGIKEARNLFAKNPRKKPISGLKKVAKNPLNLLDYLQAHGESALKARLHQLSDSELVKVARSRRIKVKSQSVSKSDLIDKIIGQVNRSLKHGSVFFKNPQKKHRKRNNTAEDRREQFAGTVSGYKQLYFPSGTPDGLSTLGPLVSIETEIGTIKPIHGQVYLCQDAAGKLYLGSTKNAPLWNAQSINHKANPSKSFGKVKRLQWTGRLSNPGGLSPGRAGQVEYKSAKPHLGEHKTVIWYHDFDNPVPVLKPDREGWLHFSGGSYRIKREGIVG
jgi:hypothetical protein